MNCLYTFHLELAYIYHCAVYLYIHLHYKPYIYIHTIYLSYTYRVQVEVLENLDVSPLAFQQVRVPPLYNPPLIPPLYNTVSFPIQPSTTNPPLYTTTYYLPLFDTVLIYPSPSFQQSMAKYQESPEIQALLGKLQVRLYYIYTYSTCCTVCCAIHMLCYVIYYVMVYICYVNTLIECE